MKINKMSIREAVLRMARLQIRGEVGSKHYAHLCDKLKIGEKGQMIVGGSKIG